MEGASTFEDESSQRNFHDFYRLGARLGLGSHGQIRRVFPRRAEAQDAQDAQAPPLASKMALRAETEVSVWRRVGQHEHCVRLVEAFESHSVWHMVMEMCLGSLMDEGATVLQMMKANPAGLLREMLLGVQHVHANGIVHRDIKLSNFLLGGVDRRTVKLSDFGCASELPKEGMLVGIYGTPSCMSPEMLVGSGYDTKHDMWSFGSTVHYLFFGAFPYEPRGKGPKIVMEAIVKDTPRLRIDTLDTSNNAVLFLGSLLQREPGRRCSADEALKSQFLDESASQASKSLCSLQMLRSKCDRRTQRILDPKMSELRSDSVSTCESLTTWSHSAMLTCTSELASCSSVSSFSSSSQSCSEPDGDEALSS